MVGFIDHHRAQYGVEPICAVLPIAPSTYHRHRRQHADPTRRSARAQRDDALRGGDSRPYAVDKSRQRYLLKVGPEPQMVAVMDRRTFLDR